MVKIVKSGFFLGEYRHALADKYRIALPRRIRAEIDGFEVILSKGFEPCIAGFDKIQWQTVAKQQIATQFNEDKGRQLRRQVFSSAVIMELDGQGRLVLPESLVKWAGLSDKLGKEVVVIGAGDHFEIWTEENWRKYSQF